MHIVSLGNNNFAEKSIWSSRSNKLSLAHARFQKIFGSIVFCNPNKSLQVKNCFLPFLSYLVAKKYNDIEKIEKLQLKRRAAMHIVIFGLNFVAHLVISCRQKIWKNGEIWSLTDKQSRPDLIIANFPYMRRT